MPPVTPEWSPPASRIDRALSPVIADLVDRGDPLDDLAVGRDHLPGLDDDVGRRRRSLVDETTSPSSDPSRSSRKAGVSARVARRLSAWALPRASASASAKLANRTVSSSRKVSAAW